MGILAPRPLNSVILSRLCHIAEPQFPHLQNGHDSTSSRAVWKIKGNSRFKSALDREISSVLCDHLEGWDREGGREMQEGGDTGIYVYV